MPWPAHRVDFPPTHYKSTAAFSFVQVHILGVFFFIARHDPIALASKEKQNRLEYRPSATSGQETLVLSPGTHKRTFVDGKWRTT